MHSMFHVPRRGEHDPVADDALAVSSELLDDRGDNGHTAPPTDAGELATWLDSAAVKLATCSAGTYAARTAAGWAFATLAYLLRSELAAEAEAEAEAWQMPPAAAVFHALPAPARRLASRTVAVEAERVGAMRRRYRAERALQSASLARATVFYAFGGYPS